MSRALRLTFLTLVLGFLYAPIALLVLYSFNASKLVTVWGGFSIKWYGALFANAQLMESAATSLKVAFVSAFLATLLGTAAAYALARFGAFRSRLLFSSMIYAPLVMPEVIIGLSILLLLVALGVERGFWTIALAHATLTSCFVAVVVHARLRDFDLSLEEAAMDLGATPFAAFRSVTLPLIAPSVAAGFMLAFTISLDDLVIASFVSGPGSTTLPMRIYSQVRLGVTPEINAVSTLLVAFVGCVVLVAALATRRQKKLSV